MVAGQLGSAGLALLSSPIVARAIGPDGRGETAAATSLFFLVPIVLALGVPLELRRRAATDEAHPLIRAARLIALASSIAAAGLAVFVYLTIFSSFEEPARVAASIGVLLSPVSIVWMCDVSVLVAHQRYRAVFAMRMIQPSVYLALVLFFWVVGLSSTSTVLWSSIAGLMATSIVGIVLTKTSLRGERVSVSDLNRSSLSFSGSAIAEAASSRLDQVVALPLIGAAQAGLYAVAATVAMIPLALGQATAAAVFSPIARSSGDARSRLQAEAVRESIVIASVSCPIVAVASVFGIPFVFGSDFGDAVPVACVCLVGSAALIVAYVSSMSLAADNKGMRMTVAQVVSLAFAIGCLLILGPWLGAIGASIASSLGYLLLVSLMLVGLRLSLRLIVPRRADLRGGFSRLAQWH